MKMFEGKKDYRFTRFTSLYNPAGPQISNESWRNKTKNKLIDNKFGRFGVMLNQTLGERKKYNTKTNKN
jgi:hypothetical protein